VKLSDVIERGRLRKFTAQHVLKYAEDALELPRSGSQGVHRLFSPAQAMRLALATRLVAAGVEVNDVPPVIGFCEWQVRRLSRYFKTGGPLYASRLTQPWRLWMIENELVQVHGPCARPDLLDDSKHFSISAGKVVSEYEHPVMIRCEGVPVTRLELNLTVLERLIRE